MIKLTIAVNASDEDFLEELLWSQGALSVGSQPPHVTERFLEVLFDDMETTALEAQLRQYLPQLGKLSVEPVKEEAWQENWRNNFKPLDVGSFKLVGEWEEGFGDDPRIVRIYPGTAFGTGQHETTQLIIEHLEALELAGKSVCDAGCGTGILSIVAERLGAKEVFGFDIDPDCTENMNHHLAINKSQHVRLEIGVLSDFPAKPYDVVLANITINVLIAEVWPAIHSWLADDGILISSGILVEQRAQAEEKLQAFGFQVTHVREKGEWVIVEARKA